MDLGIDDDLLSACVSCGLCLPHCPTYRATGDESLSPRGRITTMRVVQRFDAPVDDDVAASLDTCVQCRACETACPSGVQYGRLIEPAKRTLARTHQLTPRWQRVGLRVLGFHRVLLAGTRMLAVAQRLRIVPKRLGLPRLPLRETDLKATGSDVYLFTGCVMDAWQRSVHRDSIAVLSAAGIGVALTGPEASCCGALHDHAGLGEEAARLARRVMDGCPGDSPILVNSAGCGALMKDYGHLLGTEEAARFSRRVFDIHEWLAQRADVPPGRVVADRVAVQDPCHLRHVQRVHHHVRTLLAPVVGELVEIADDGRCCGAGGSFSMVHPDLAGVIRDQKVAAIDVTGATVVVSANPGCAFHLAGGLPAGVEVVHPMTLLARSLDG